MSKNKIMTLFNTIWEDGKANGTISRNNMYKLEELSLLINQPIDRTKLLADYLKEAGKHYLELDHDEYFRQRLSPSEIVNILVDLLESKEYSEK